MYALLFPSAHNFISAVEENVNVEVRAMGVPTPTPTPCLLPSPAWTALVCAPRCCCFCVEEFVFIVQPFCARRLAGAKHQFGAARPAASGCEAFESCPRYNLARLHF